MTDGFFHRLFFSTICIAAALLVLRVYLHLARGASTSIQTPPGPKGLALFGNAFQVPTNHFGLYLKRLHEIHGGLVYLNINGANIYSIGTQELAKEVLERRSIIYSSRPVIPYFNRYYDPLGLIWAFNRPGENHYWGRRISSTVMKHVREGHGEAIQRLEALAILQVLVEDEGRDWYHHIERQAGSVIISAMFGVGSLEGNSSEVKQAMKLVDNLIAAMSLNASMINFFPLLDDLIPACFSTPWRRKAATSMENDRKAWDTLLDVALDGKGTDKNTWASMFANEKTPDGADRRYLVTQFAAAAIETTSTALHSFILACISHPEWVKNAQTELDHVVGKDRLPTFEDRPMLPYVEATMREVLRWNPPLHAGVAHANTADDVIQFNGKEYFVPKGSTIYYAVHAIEHDKSRFTEPHMFRPEHFLDADGNLKDDYCTSVFGLGRRACVGIPFAERSLWITIAAILWTFNIRKIIDTAESKAPFPYDIPAEALKGTITNGPFEFPARFEPRDPHRVLVAKMEWEDCEKDLAVLLAPMDGTV